MYTDETHNSETDSLESIVYQGCKDIVQRRTMLPSDPNAKSKRSVKHVKLLDVGAAPQRKQDVDGRHLVGRVEEQEVFHVFLGEIAHVLPLVRIADLGHPALC